MKTGKLLWLGAVLILAGGLTACRSGRETAETPGKRVPVIPELPKIPEQQKKRSVTQILPPEKNTDKFFRKDSFADNWVVLPQQRKRPETLEECRSVLHKEGLENERSLTAGFLQKDVRFQTFANHGADLGGAVDAATVLCYLCGTFQVPETMKDLTLCTGSNALLKIWINEELVSAYDRDKRPFDFDQDKIPGITLKKGINHVVVKTVRLEPEWKFSFRFTRSDGSALRFVTQEK